MKLTTRRLSVGKNRPVKALDKIINDRSTDCLVNRIGGSGHVENFVCKYYRRTVNSWSAL
jgi:hypothetical protein